MSVALAQQLALAYLGRPIDLQWQSATANLLNGNPPPAPLFAPSPFLQAWFQAAIADGRFSATDSVTTIVNKIFNHAFGRNATTFEQTAWGNLIANGTIPKESAPWLISQAYFNATNTPSEKAAMTARLEAIADYATALAGNPQANVALSQAGSAAANAAFDWLKPVVDAATKTTQTGQIQDVLTGTTPAGQTYVLKIGPDTATANKFVSNPEVNALGQEVQTLNSADNLTGVGSNPTLQVLRTDTVGTTIIPTLNGIETLKWSNLGSAGVVLNGANTTGLKAIEVNNSVEASNFVNLQTKLERVRLHNTAVDTVVSVAAAALSGSSDEIQVVLDKVLAGATLAVNATSGSNGYETIKVKVEGSNSTIDQITSNTSSSKTIVFEGDKDLTIRGVNPGGTSGANPLWNTLTSIDASAMTGKFTLGQVGLSIGGGSGAFAASSTASGSVTIKGGSGDDTFVISDLGSKYNIQGGGGNDTLIVTATANAGTDPAGVTSAPTLSGIETLKVLKGDGTGVGTPVSLNLLGVSGIKTLELGKSGSTGAVITLNNLTHNDEFTIKGVGTGQAGFQSFNGVNYQPLGVTGGSDKVTLEFGNKGASIGANTMSVGNITLGGIENVSLTVKDLGTSGTANFGTFTASNLKNMELVVEGGNSGAGSVTFFGALGGAGGTVSTFKLVSDAGVTVQVNQAAGASFEVSGAGKHSVSANTAGNSVVINAAATTGGVTLNGNTASDTIIGGSGNDTITGGLGADRLTGGAGADVFVFASNNNSPATSITFSNGGNANSIDDGDTFTFNSAIDVITDFAAGDKLDVASNASIINMYNVASSGGSTNRAWFVRGDWAEATLTFTVSSSGSDTLVFQNLQNATFSNNANAGVAVVLLGYNAPLTNADVI